MRLAKTLVSTLALAGLVAAVGCADNAEKMSGVDHKAKSAPAVSAPATSAPMESAPAASAPATSAPATSAPATSAPASSAPAK